jgi:hypothetical protein
MYLRCSVDTSVERISSATNSQIAAYEVQRGDLVQFEGRTIMEDEEEEESSVELSSKERAPASAQTNSSKSSHVKLNEATDAHYNGEESPAR